MNMWLLLLPAAPLARTLHSQRSMWRWLYAWRLRSPAAVEPSDDGYRLWRSLDGLGPILPVIVGTVWEDAGDGRDTQQRWDRYWVQRRRRHEECLLRHHRDPNLPVPAEVPCTVWSPQPVGGQR